MTLRLLVSITGALVPGREASTEQVLQTPQSLGVCYALDPAGTCAKRYCVCRETEVSALDGRQ